MRESLRNSFTFKCVNTTKKRQKSGTTSIIALNTYNTSQCSLKKKSRMRTNLCLVIILRD